MIKTNTISILVITLIESYKLSFVVATPQYDLQTADLSHFPPSGASVKCLPPKLSIKRSPLSFPTHEMKKHLPLACTNIYCQYDMS